jgi:hypothetical protein
MPTHALRYNRYCEGCDPVNPPVLISRARFSRKHHVSASQIARLLRRRVLVAKKFKGQNWIGFHPEFEKLGITLAEYMEYEVLRPRGRSARR